MKDKDFDLFFKSLVSEAYSFCFSLVPDDLQAQQIVIDSVSIFSLEDTEDIGKLFQFQKDEGQELLNHQKRLRRILFKRIYQLSLKRFTQIEEGLQVLREENRAGFYGLDVESRGVLYLKHRFNATIEEIEQITDMLRHQVLVVLNTARDRLLRHKGMGSDWILPSERQN